MFAIGDFGDADVAACKKGLQFTDVACGNIGVLQALQDEDRAARIERLAGKKMRAAVFDQVASDRVGFAVV